jgi:tetratricopeptide (TPR) repeat protein
MAMRISKNDIFQKVMPYLGTCVSLIWVLISVAFEAYFRSAELNPQHHRALSSISQTQFERGNYELSVKYLKDAVRLLDPGRASRATLRSLARMNLLLKEYDEASRYVGRMNPGVSKDRHSDALDMALQTHAAQRRCARNVRNLPRYKPTAANASKYFSVGDDDATSMYDKLLESHTDENENHSFFFTGICDSRHIFQTLISIVINGAAQPGAPATKFHFTIHDADPVVLARNMIFYFLLEQLAPEIPKLYYKGKYAANWISKKGEKILATLFFTYIAQVMPPVVFDHLQATIGLVIESLLGTTELPSWIKLDPKGIPPMLEALRFWQSQGVSKFSTGHFIDQTCSRHDLDEEDYLDTFTWVPDGCEAEIMDYCETAMLLPPSFAIDPCLQQILDLSDSQERRRVLRPYIRMNWKPNVTLVHSSSEVDSHLGHNPADLMYHLYNGSDCNLPSNPNKLFDYAYDFFGEVARAVKLLGDRLVFEVVSGEVTQVLDSIRYRFEEDRDPTYPTEYDRIHLSNVP